MGRARYDRDAMSSLFICLSVSCVALFVSEFVRFFRGPHQQICSGRQTYSVVCSTAWYQRVIRAFGSRVSPLRYDTQHIISR